uniref:Uncharacterized protein LOC111119529 n=1 Tax=Crassostrea virginica TaxID=6565 RepID=A0A8B8CI98_CRAVI|nr:uncharacterized protein LOC111119529 [Crassostrea virginica]
MSDNANEEDIEMANEYTKDEVRDSGNMGGYESSDEQEELCAQDEVPEGNMSSRTYVMTPVSTYQLDDDLLKSIVSFRHRNRTLVKNSNLNYTTADTTPEAVKKHMNFMGSPERLTPTLKQPGSVKRRKQRRVTINNLVLEQSYQTEEQQRLSVSVGSLPSVSLNSTSVHIFQTTTSESPYSCVYAITAQNLEHLQHGKLEARGGPAHILLPQVQCGQ